MDNYRIPHQRQARTRVSPEEQFARLLEVHSQSAAVAGAEGGISRLLSVATALRTASPQLAPAPLSPESRAAMRQRLVAVASVTDFETSSTAVTGRAAARRAEAIAYRMRRRMVALAGSFTIVTGFAGVGVAAAHSLPGDPFYGVKKATESVQLWATHGDTAKGKLHLAFARTRLAEAAKLSPDSSHLVSTLAAMNSQTEQGTSELIAAYQSSHSTQPLAAIVTFTQKQYSDLAELATHLPASLQPAEATALSVLTSVTTTVRTVSGQNCLSCLVTASGGPTGLPGPPVGSQPGTQSSPAPQPTESASGGSTHPSTSNPTPSQSPGDLVPTNLLPSNLQPSSLLPGLLGNGDKSPKKHHPSPTLSPLPLISSLVSGLSL
jgi:hypothetical protein